jgi:hypothetical protein
MPEPKRRNAGLSVLKWMMPALIAWGAGYVIALKILKHHPHSAWTRGGAVALGVFGFLSWLGWMAKAIRVENEFSRQIHLMSLAIGFAATAIFIFACDMLQRAAFIDYVSLMTIWLVMFVTWMAALMLSSWYYR